MFRQQAHLPQTSRTRSPRGWALAGGVLGGLCTLTLYAPAHWLTTPLAQVTAHQVQLQQPRGTIWNGSARLVLTGGEGSADAASLPGRLNWKLRPTFTGARLSVDADCCTQQPLTAQVQLRWGGLQVKVNDQLSHWPAAVLAGLGTPWNTLQPQGKLALQTKGLLISANAGRLVVDGQVQLDALDVSSRLSTLRPMGSYRVLVQGGNAPTLNVSTLGGALLVSGSGQWVGQRLRFNGEARAAPGREAALANLLNIIGRRTGDRSILTVG